MLATRLEVDGGRFTGRTEGPLCYGRGKVQQSELLAAQLGFSLHDAFFYTDSVADLPLLERVGVPIAVNPDRRLRHNAARRGWRIERWA